MRAFKVSNLGISISVALGVVVLLCAVLARLMNYQLRRDEQMYAPPATLLEHYGLFTEIFYNHVPVSAWWFRFVKVALGTDHLLLAARVGVFGGWLFLAASIAWISYALTRSLAMTALSFLLIMTNDALLTVTGMTATNNLLPLPFAYLGLGLFLLGLSGDRVRSLVIGISGVSLALAASIKASAVGFIPPVALAAFFLPVQTRFSSRLLRVVLPLAVGGIIGALPVLLYLAADPERFFAHVVGFHTGPHVAYWAAQVGAEVDVAMSPAAKAKLAYLVWTDGANGIFIFVFALLLVLLAQGEGLPSLRRKLLTGPPILVSAAFLMVVVMSFVPTPSFPQYFAPPLVCASLLLALLYGKLDAGQRIQVRPALIAASLVLVLLNLPRLTQHLGRLPNPDSWTVTRVHQDGLEIARRLSEAKVEGKVATLAPVYPLEAKLPIYLELATGQFAYRTAEFTDEDLARHYRTTSPSAIKDLFESDPPAALLVGFAPDLESPMVHFAEENGYRRVDDLGLVDRYGVGILYVKSKPTTQ